MSIKNKLIYGPIIDKLEEMMIMLEAAYFPTDSDVCGTIPENLQTVIKDVLDQCTSEKDDGGYYTYSSDNKTNNRLLKLTLDVNDQIEALIDTSGIQQTSDESILKSIGLLLLSNSLLMNFLLEEKHDYISEIISQHTKGNISRVDRYGKKVNENIN